MSATRITVVIPVKNDAAMLADCLRALARQSRQADEIIVVDNGSSDDSAAVAREFAATVVTEPGRGIAAANATGFDAATGDIIARLDADSVPADDWIASIERILGDSPHAVGVTGPGTFYDLRQPFRFVADVLYMRAYLVLSRIALANHPLFGSNFAIRRESWIRVRSHVHRHDAEVHDDFDLSYHLNPWDLVLVDPGLVVGISARPFRDGRGMVIRMSRALRTMAIHGVGQLPPARWARRSRRLRGVDRPGADDPRENVERHDDPRENVERLGHLDPFEKVDSRGRLIGGRRGKRPRGEWRGALRGNDVSRPAAE